MAIRDGASRFSPLIGKYGPCAKGSLTLVSSGRSAFLQLESAVYKNTDEIKRVDIALAYYIKKRAKGTKGGFNFIPKEMWEWQPIFEIDSSLLPKIKR